LRALRRQSERGREVAQERAFGRRVRAVGGDDRDGDLVGVAPRLRRRRAAHGVARSTDGRRASVEDREIDAIAADARRDLAQVVALALVGVAVGERRQQRDREDAVDLGVGHAPPGSFGDDLVLGRDRLPLRELDLEALGERGRATQRPGSAPSGSSTVASSGRGDRDDLAVQALDDRRRRAGWREHADPDVDVEAGGDAGERRQVGERGMRLGGRHRDRRDLARS
jgi:hypothetical protein